MGWAGTVAQLQYNGMRNVRMGGRRKSMLAVRFIHIMRRFWWWQPAGPKTQQS